MKTTDVTFALTVFKPQDNVPECQPGRLLIQWGLRRHLQNLSALKQLKHWSLERKDLIRLASDPIYPWPTVPTCST